MCPSCSLTFCRECVTEHDDRLLCVSCLARASALVKPTQRGRFRAGLAGLRRLLASCAGVALAWWLFDSVGRLLLLLPSSVHEGTIWTSSQEGGKGP